MLATNASSSSTSVQRSPGTRRNAGSQIKTATAFLQWLTQNNRNLRECTQGDLNRWHAEHRVHERQIVTPFLRWAMRTQQMPRLVLPRHQTGQRAPIIQHRRLALLRRLFTDDTAPLRTRVAAIVMLLYAQPLTRIIRLTTDDILVEDGQVLLRFGTPSTHNKHVARVAADAGEPRMSTPPVTTASDTQQSKAGNTDCSINVACQSHAPSWLGPTKSAWPSQVRVLRRVRPPG